jgi:hypothetical protein
MPVTAAHVADVAARLTRDLRSFGMDSYVYLIEHESANARSIVDDPDRYFEKVVEDVQQDILDSIVVWPPCPHHPNHPLWFHNGSWHCEQLGVAIAPVGALHGS